MPDWNFRIIPDLPKPPVELIGGIDFSIRPANEEFSPDSSRYLGIKQRSDWKKQQYDWIQPMASNKNVRHHFDEEFTNWIKSNITPEFQSSNSGIMFFNEPQLPHTDTTRDFVLLYNVASEARKRRAVSFWQESKQPLRRERGCQISRARTAPHVDRQRQGAFRYLVPHERARHSLRRKHDRRARKFTGQLRRRAAASICQPIFVLTCRNPAARQPIFFKLDDVVLHRTTALLEYFFDCATQA